MSNGTYESITQDLDTLLGLKNDEFHQRFLNELSSKELSSTGYDASPEDTWELLWLCVGLVRESVQAADISGLPTAGIRTLATHIHSICHRIETGANVAQWYSEVFALEWSLWENGIRRGVTEGTALRKEIGELRNSLVTLRDDKKRVDEILKIAGTIPGTKEAAEAHQASIEKLAAEADESITKIRNCESNASNLVSEATKSRGNAASAETEIETRRNRVEEFFEQIKEHQQKMKETQETAETGKTAWEEFVSAASDVRKDYESQLSDLLQMAVGTSLFTAFNKEKSRYNKQSWWWCGFTLAALGGAIIFAWLFAQDVKQSIASGVSGIPPFFWIRLSMSPLFFFAIGFCAKQYANHKRLEHAYAFKSTLSVSLDPYKRLVMAMRSDDEQQPHLDFVVETIRQIYTSPLGKPEPDREASVIESTISEGLKGLFDAMRQGLTKG